MRRLHKADGAGQVYCVVMHAKTIVLLLHQKINNDISYVFKALPYPYQGTKDKAKSLIKSLLNEHLNESVAAPFFNEADDLDCLREELPEGWNIELGEESRQAKSTLRIVVYNDMTRPTAVQAKTSRT